MLLSTDHACLAPHSAVADFWRSPSASDEGPISISRADRYPRDWQASLSKVLPFLAAGLLFLAVLSESLTATIAAFVALCLWIHRQRKLRLQREEDDLRAALDNYPCSRCGTLLRGRKVGHYDGSGGHSKCIGFYCYSCAAFDNWPMDDLEKESKAKQQANGLKW